MPSARIASPVVRKTTSKSVVRLSSPSPNQQLPGELDQDDLAPFKVWISTLPSIELPPSKFTGRFKTLNEIHDSILKMEDETEPLKRLIIISGLEGMGKTSLILKYIEKFSCYFQNIWWIDASNKLTLENSFLSLAQHFKIPEMQFESIVDNIYQHFSLHVKSGLFIFDNVKTSHKNQSEKSGKMNLNSKFGIENYLPRESLENLPYFIVTVDKMENFDDIHPLSKDLKIIELNCLNVVEQIQFLKLALDLPNEISSSMENSLEKLGELFGGYPLAINLIATSISLDLNMDPLTFDDIEKYTEAVQYKVEANIQEFKSIGKNSILIEMEEFDQKKSFDKLMRTIWQQTMDKMKRRQMPQANLNLAVQLLNLISYLPADRLSIKFLDCLIRNVECRLDSLNSRSHDYNLNRDQISGDHQSQSEVHDTLKILQKFGLISIYERDYWGYEGREWIRFHPLVQKWTRENLKFSGNLNYLTKIVDYFQWNLDRLPQSYFDCVEGFLKELKWPGKSFCLKLKQSFHGAFKFYWLDKKQKDLIELLELFKKDTNTNQSQEEGNWNFYNWFKFTLVYYQSGKPLGDMDRRGGKLLWNDLMDLTKSIFYDQQNANKFLVESIKMGEFLNWSLKQVETFPDNYQIGLVVLDLVGNLWESIEKDDKYLDWIGSFLKWIQAPNTKITNEIARRFLKFVTLAELISTQSLMEFVFKTIEIRLTGINQENHFNCWQFYWNALNCIEDWPNGIWIEDSCKEISNWSLEKGNSCCHLFLSAGGVKIWTKLLIHLEQERNQQSQSRIYKIQDGVNLVFERMMSLIYFDDCAQSLLDSQEFKIAFENSAIASLDALISARLPLKCKVIGTVDRFLMIWFGLFVKNLEKRKNQWRNGFLLKEMESAYFMYDKVFEYLLTLGTGERRLQVDFLWFKWETRRVLLESFLNSMQPNAALAGILLKFAYKLQQFSSIL